MGRGSRGGVGVEMEGGGGADGMDTQQRGMDMEQDSTRSGRLRRKSQRAKSAYSWVRPCTASKPWCTGDLYY